MNNIANSELLDDSISNSASLKSRRINNTARTAVNPNPNPPQQSQPNENEDDENEDLNNELTEDYGKARPDFSTANRNTKTSSDNSSNEKKILGMKPVLFYTLLGVAVVVGGIFLYKKYGKKGKGKIAPPATSGTGSPAPEVKITP